MSVTRRRTTVCSSARKRPRDGSWAAASVCLISIRSSWQRSSRSSSASHRYRRRKTKQTALFLLIFSTFRSDTRYDQVMVFFDEDGTVEHIGVDLERENTKYELL